MQPRARPIRLPLRLDYMNVKKRITVTKWERPLVIHQRDFAGG
jgi:hypothetical protein